MLCAENNITNMYAFIFKFACSICHHAKTACGELDNVSEEKYSLLSFNDNQQADGNQADGW